MVDGDFANFRAVYDDLTNEVERAHYQFLPDHLANWFRTIDTTPAVARIVSKLQNGLDFDSWYKKVSTTAGGMGGTLSWPDSPEKRLGMQLLLFRAVAAGKVDISWMAHVFHPSSDRSINDAARRFVDQVFGPMARELRRHLEREASTVPAADRIVHLDHNQPAYQEATQALERLEQTLREANDYPDPQDKDQRIAEVSAGRRLLQSARVRIGAIAAVIVPTVMYLASHFVGTAIDTASSAVIEKLTALLGAIF
jgi:hypothetical protein